MQDIAVIFLISIAICVPIVLVIGAFYLISRIPKVGKNLCSGLVLCFVYIVYDAIWPSDSYYIDIFTVESGVSLGGDIKILKKYATYPDFHGDFWAEAVMKAESIDTDSMHKDITRQSQCSIENVIEKLQSYDFDLALSNRSCWKVQRAIDQRFSFVHFKEESVVYFQYMQN